MSVAARKQARIPEKVVQQHIVTLLRSIGGTVYVLGTTRRRGDFHGTMQTPGIGDLYAFLPKPPRFSGQPTALWIEVKAKGGRLRPEQVEFRAHCARAAVAHVTGDLDAVIQFLCDGGWLSAANLPNYRTPSTTQSGAESR